MSEQTCTDKEIKKQLDDMPLEEFEDFLKGVTAKGHEGRPQHAELLSQLKHNVKVQPDEPIQTKATDKDCRTFWKSLNQKDNQNQTNQHLSSTPADNACSNTTSSSTSGGKANSSTTFNGNILYSGTHVANYVHRPKQPTLLGPGSTSTSSSASNKSFSLNSGDQNANQISSGASIPTDSVSSSYHSKHNSVHDKLNDYNSHHHVHKSTLNCNNSLDGDPGGVSNRRSQERDTSNKGNTDNTSTRSNSIVPNKNSLNRGSTVNNNGDDDDNHQETYLKPTEFTGKLPPQYIGTAVSKIKDLQSQVFPKTLPNSISMTPLHGSSIQQSSSSSQSLSSIGNRDDAFDTQSTSAKSSWDSSRINSRRTESLQLKDGYKSVSSVTSGDAPSYSGTAASSSTEDTTFGTVHAASTTLPSSAVVSKSPTIISSDGSQLDKPAGGRRGADRKKKSSKNVLRETLINPQEMPGYKGTEKDIDKLLEFVEGNQTKPKKPSKDKKQREGKLSKGNEKQVLSKAASLDENSLEYGSKKTGDDPISPRTAQNRNNKDVEKKNSANITKSASAICADDSSSILQTSDTRITSPVPPNQQESKSSSSSVSSTCSSSFSSTKSVSINHPLVNGDSPIPGPKTASKVVAANSLSTGGNKTAPSPCPKNQAEALGLEGSQPSKSLTQTVSSKKSEVPPVSSSIQTVVPQNQGKISSNDKMKLEDDRSEKMDENPYVLVQKKKKKDQRKPPPRETENFHRSHPEQTRRDVVRPRRSNTERRKSVGSVPGSENEGSDDDDSVRSLPAGECTPRERIPKPCSSSGGTPQTSYADIARMSKGENEKPSNTATVPTNAPAATPSPAAPVVPSQPKTPTPAPPTKNTPQSVVSVGGTPEDMNFPALSPPTSSEKTAATPVSTAVWPCRPRAIEMETPSSNKDKQGTTINNNTINNNSSKSDDVLCNDDSFPPVVVTIPTATDSQKGSKTKETTTVPANSKSPTVNPVHQTSINNNNKEVSGKPVADTPIISKVESSIVQNGVIPRNNAIVDATPKVVATNKARLEDKKAKDKSAKPVSEEHISKPASRTVSENGDHHPTLPVVFCGGKFDTTQLPVGQKIGFEFGFGVIEALNDNTNLSEKSMPEPKSKNFSAVLKRSGSTGTPASTAPSEMRSQDQSVSLNHDCTLKQKSVSMPKELPSVSSNEIPPQKQTNQQKQNANKNRGQQNVTNSTGGPSKSTPRAASTDAVPPNHQNNRSVTPKASEQPAETVPKPLEAVVTAVPKVIQGNSAPKAASSTAVADSTVSLKPTVEGKLTPKEITTKINVAQIFIPLKGVSVPSSVHQSNSYMENYISQLTSLKEKGKVSIHRVA